MHFLTYITLCSILFVVPEYLPAQQHFDRQNLCQQYIDVFEQKERIPRGYLSAIALVESGRRIVESGKREPWPWTIHAEGKGLYFETKEKAIEAVHSLQKKGVKNIDVGCMQINLQHHGHHFKHVHDAFDPQRNVQFAAKFLKEKLTQSSSWQKALGNYHSHIPEHHHAYIKRVKYELARLNGNGEQQQQFVRRTVNDRVNSSHYRTPLLYQTSLHRRVPFKKRQPGEYGLTQGKWYRLAKVKSSAQNATDGVGGKFIAYRHNAHNTGTRP